MEKKECYTCNVSKNISEFSINKKKKSGVNDVCKKCHSEYTKKHYKKNKSEYLSRNKQRAAEVAEFLRTYKTGKPCHDCGFVFDPAAMDFDHISDNKEFNVSSLARSGSIKSITKEILKCELVCANCHRVRTKNRRIDRNGNVPVC